MRALSLGRLTTRQGKVNMEAKHGFSTPKLMTLALKAFLLAGCLVALGCNSSQEGADQEQAAEEGDYEDDETEAARGSGNVLKDYIKNPINKARSVEQDSADRYEDLDSKLGE